MLKTLLALVPVLLRKMIILGGTTSLSAVDFGVVRRFYILQVCISVGAWVNVGAWDHLPVGSGLWGGPLLHTAGVHYRRGSGLTCGMWVNLDVSRNVGSTTERNLGWCML